VLRLCDKDQLAHHLLFAILYEKEIRTLLGREDEGDTVSLARHLRALDLNPQYGRLIGMP
jgi:hypothetical protein